MTEPHAVVIGAGAAGAAAASRLAAAGLRVTVVAGADGLPYNRTLVNKGVAIGMLPPELIAQPPLAGVELLTDTAVAVDADARQVRLASGDVLGFDALILATGSAPRELDGALVSDAARASGRVTTLHSLADAIRVRELLTSPAEVLIAGAGLVGAETATLLRRAGHRVTLIARAEVPAVSAFGAEIAARLADAHRAELDVAFGRDLARVDVDGDRVAATLDDGTVLTGDVLIVALGTVPSAPEPWTAGVEVDERMRVAGSDAVFAAGGVATHETPTLGSWRIDHWADAGAQGEHAALAVLHALGRGDAPGAYLPRSMHTSQVHGHMLAAVGLTAAGPGELVSEVPPMVVHVDADGAPIGVAGLDAVGEVLGWAPRLHLPAQNTPGASAAPAASVGQEQ
ncbi:MAG: ferredoxin reductase [Leifsonia xyli]|nr:MAG: ferredoxin reductase [Leifsonia xyli]